MSETVTIRILTDKGALLCVGITTASELVQGGFASYIRPHLSGVETPESRKVDQVEKRKDDVRK